MLDDYIPVFVGAFEDEDDSEGWSGVIDHGTCFME